MLAGGHKRGSAPGVLRDAQLLVARPGGLTKDTPFALSGSTVFFGDEETTNTFHSSRFARHASTKTNVLSVAQQTKLQCSIGQEQGPLATYHLNAHFLVHPSSQADCPLPPPVDRASLDCWKQDAERATAIAREVGDALDEELLR